MIMEHKHGGNIENYIRKYGRVPLDFSASINPFGCPAHIKEAMIKAVGEIDRYPDPDCLLLREKTAQHMQSEYGIKCEKEMILCGNGASELIHTLLGSKQLTEVLIPVPAFSCYIKTLNALSKKTVKYELKAENGFRIGNDITELITEEVKLVILTEPNNPTGVLTDMRLKEDILKKCESSGSFLLIDESFIEFTEDHRRNSMAYLLDSDRLLILRAFTKYYGMPGIRLGYIISSNTDMINKLKEAESDWNVNLIAQKAGIAALEADEGNDRLIVYINNEKQYMYDKLKEAGYMPLKSDANYILFKGEKHLAERLEERGIMIRDCSSFEGLTEGWYRISVKMHEENERLIGVMNEIKKG